MDLRSLPRFEITFAIPDTRRLPRTAPEFKLRRSNRNQRSRIVTIAHISAIFADARAVHANALQLLESGDIRDAAEKAWCGTKRATDVLILARTGVEPVISSDTTRGLVRLEAEDRSVSSLVRRYFSRQGHLHGACFYLGACEPLDEVERRIRQTADYISDAEDLAAQMPSP